MLKPGDHVCAIFSDHEELATLVGDFLSEGLRTSEQCWYLPASDDPGAVRAALASRQVDALEAEERGALRILSPVGTYRVGGGFDPEATMAVFNDAIEQALADGFDGFRAAANMSWALDLENGPEVLVTYEALLSSLFASARATGLCLYDRGRMPLEVIDGALATHPIVRANAGYSSNAFYDPTVRSIRPVDPAAVTAKLDQLSGSTSDGAGSA